MPSGIETPPPPSQLNPRIPPTLDAIIMRLLEKEPERRFRTATELARALRSVMKEMR